MKTIKFFIWYTGVNHKKIKHLILLTKIVIRQKIAEIWCKKRHNQWEQLQPSLHGAGKYVYNCYKCSVCGRMYVVFDVN